MPYDGHVRSLLNSRSARTDPLTPYYSPTQTADTFSLRSPHPRESPSLTDWSESPSCYSRSRMSVDDSTSEVSLDNITSVYYGQQSEHDSDLHMASVLQKHRGSAGTFGGDRSDANTTYRASYVDPLRDSSEDEQKVAQGGVSGSQSTDTLSDTGAPRPIDSDTSISSGLSADAMPDLRLSFLGPKTRMISKAPWEEDTIEEEALSDTETQTDALSIFAGKLKPKGRSRSKTLTSGKAEKERRFLGGGWGRSSTDTRPSMDSFKRSMESSIGGFPQTPISPRTGSFSDQSRLTARTPSIFSTSSGTSSPGGAQLSWSGARPGMGAQSSSGLTISPYGMDSRATSPAPSTSPVTSNFVHPYANLELLPPGHEARGSFPSRSDSNTTLTASTGVSPYITPSTSSSSATSPGQDETHVALKKEKRRPPQISVSPLNHPACAASSTKSPSALSTSFGPLSPSLLMTPAGNDDGAPAGMFGFPGSPAYNLITLEQAQMKARERSKSAGPDVVQESPRRKELSSKRSKPSLVGVGGGFSSTIGGGSPSPLRPADDGRTRTVSAGSALHGRPRGYTATSTLAAQSTTSVNVIQGGGIENIPEASTSRSSAFTASTIDSTGSSGLASVTSADSTLARTLKPKRSGFLKFFKDKAGSSSSSGHPNISAPSTPVHIAHNTMDPPPVPKVPTQFQSAKMSSPPDLELLHDRAPPPVVVSSPGRARSFERGRSFSDDSHTSIGDHAGGHVSRERYLRSNTEPARRPDNRQDNIDAQGSPFNGLKLRPVSSAFNGLPEDYLLSSPQGGSASRGSSEDRASNDYGFEETSILSPITPSFPASARSTYTHVSSASSGSDVFSSSVDPRTPSSLASFPPGVPRTSTDSQNSAAIIAGLREQLRCVRKASVVQISELENQVQELKLELEEARCDRCSRRNDVQRKPSESGVVNRPRARTGGGTRTTFGAQ